jgi:carbohydrate-selective porin OprB
MAAVAAVVTILRSSALLVALAQVAHADLMPDPCACSANKPGFFRTGTLTGNSDDIDKLRAAWKDDGFIPQLTYASEVFTSPELSHHAVFAGLVVLGLDFDFGKLVTDGLGTAHVAAVGIHGDGLSAELKDVYGVSGNVAPQDIRLFEAWVEQSISKFTLRGGILAADQEFILARHSTALLNATFGIISQLSFNLSGPVYPVGTPGLSGRFELTGFTARAAVYDGDQANVHGIPRGLGSDVLAIGEVEYGELLKVGAWHHSKFGNGAYAIVDHQLGRYLGAFVRGGASPNEPVRGYIDTGVRIGPGPFRDGDFIGAGVAWARTDMMGDQIVLEGTYQAQFGWLTIQPDLQLVMLHDRTAAIIATRVTIVL